MANYQNEPVSFAPISNVTATPGTNDPEVGARTTRGDEDYVYCFNAGNSDIPPTYGCILSAVTGYSVTISSITGVDQLVGVVKHKTLTTATYGWVMVRGFSLIEMEADNSAAAGVSLALAADGEFAHKSASTQYPGNACGKAMAAIASAASGMAFIGVF